MSPVDVQVISLNAYLLRVRVTHKLFGLCPGLVFLIPETERKGYLTFVSVTRYCHTVIPNVKDEVNQQG